MEEFFNNLVDSVNLQDPSLNYIIAIVAIFLVFMYVRAVAKIVFLTIIIAFVLVAGLKITGHDVPYIGDVIAAIGNAFSGLIELADNAESVNNFIDHLPLEDFGDDSDNNDFGSVQQEQ